MRILCGGLLFSLGFSVFITQSRADQPSIWIVVGGLLAMVIGAFVAEGFRQRGAIFLLLCIAIGAAVGIAVGWFVSSHPDQAGLPALSAGLYSGFAAGIISGLSGLLIKVLRRPPKAPRRERMSPED